MLHHVVYLSQCNMSQIETLHTVKVNVQNVTVFYKSKLIRGHIFTLIEHTVLLDAVYSVHM